MTIWGWKGELGTCLVREGCYTQSYSMCFNKCCCELKMLVEEQSRIARDNKGDRTPNRKWTEAEKTDMLGKNFRKNNKTLMRDWMQPLWCWAIHVLWLVSLYTWFGRYLFLYTKLIFIPLGIYPKVVWLDHIEVLVLILWGNCILISIATGLIYFTIGSESATITHLILHYPYISCRCLVSCWKSFGQE